MSEACHPEAIARAIQMLKIASRHIRLYSSDRVAFYDDAQCDGNCVADDCDSVRSQIEASNWSETATLAGNPAERKTE